MITREDLSERLRCDPDVGKFYFTKNWGWMKIGKEAGYTTGYYYWKISYGV